MDKIKEPKATYADSPDWIWGRIRAVRNIRVEVNYLEACLLELKSLKEIEIRKQKTPAQPS